MKPDGTVMLRPWVADEPARDLRAKYRPDWGPDLDIDLGPPGFSLQVNYEYGDIHILTYVTLKEPDKPPSQRAI